MKDETLVIIGGVLNADTTLSVDDVSQIMASVYAHGKNKEPMSDMITAKQAGVILRCHPRTIFRYASQGQLRSVYHSKRRVRFYRDEVAALATGGSYEHA